MLGQLAPRQIRRKGCLEGCQEQLVAETRQGDKDGTHGQGPARSVACASVRACTRVVVMRSLVHPGALPLAAL